MDFVGRGFALRFWLSKRLDKVAGEWSWTVSRLVNEVVVAYLEKLLSGDEIRRFELLVEEQTLLAESQRLFLLIKRVLCDGVYVNDAAKSVIPEDENLMERWQKKQEGVYNRLTKEELDFLLRAFAAREKNTRRIVEIERQLLPEDRLEMPEVEKGWRLRGNRRQEV